MLFSYSIPQSYSHPSQPEWQINTLQQGALCRHICSVEEPHWLPFPVSCRILVQCWPSPPLIIFEMSQGLFSHMFITTAPCSTHPNILLFWTFIRVCPLIWGTFGDWCHWCLCINSIDKQIPWFGCQAPYSTCRYYPWKRGPDLRLTSPCDHFPTLST
jgi:hypothetical protein